MFSPEDLALVKGDPSDRRRFLDDAAGAAHAAAGRRPRRLRPGAQAAQHPAEVGAAVAGGRRSRSATLDIWDDEPGAHGCRADGARLVLARRARPAPRRGVRRRRRAAPRAIAQTSRRPTSRRSISRPTRRPDADRGRRCSMRSSGAARRDGARRHAGRPASRRRRPDDRRRCRQGLRESRRVLVAGARAAARVLRAAARGRGRAGADPRRRVRRARPGAAQQLAELVGDAEQVLVTAAVADDVPEALKGHRFNVARGEVIRD